VAIVILLFIVVGTGVYLGNYYRADEQAIEIATQTGASALTSVTVINQKTVRSVLNQRILRAD
jgi:Flp pilus assembly protein TadG